MVLAFSLYVLIFCEWNLSALFCVKSRHLSFFGHLVRRDENADASQVILKLPPESWRRPLGSHILPGWRPSKAIFLPWIWSCMKPKNWLRVDRSGDWCLCLALRTRSGAWYYWIGLDFFCVEMGTLCMEEICPQKIFKNSCSKELRFPMPQACKSSPLHSG